MSDLLKDKIIVVTGGSGLLGRAFVRAVTDAGGLAINADINKSETTKDSEFIQLDITNKTSIAEVIHLVSERYGKIDALVNNAYPRNKQYGRHFMEVEYSDFCENINLNLGGYFLTSQQFCDYFLKQGFGNIVNIASVYGVVAPSFEIYEGTSMTMPVEYSVIKSGVLHLTKYLAKLFKDKNIRVNAISPGGILDSQPASFLQAYREKCLNKGMLEPSDLTGTLIYLLSDLSTHMNGQNLIVDDGFTI